MAKATKVGFNVHPQAHWTELSLTIDMMKGASDWFGDNGNPTWTNYNATRANKKRDDWLVAFPAGLTVSTVIKNSRKVFTAPAPFLEGRKPMDFKTGKYVATWTGLATVTISGSGSGVAVSANRYEFTVPANSDNLSLNIVVANNTANPVDVTDIKVFHIDDEARLNSGKIYKDNFLQSLKGASNIRTMDLMNPMRYGMFDSQTGDLIQPWSVQVQASELLTESSRVWRDRWPSTAIGKLAAEFQEIDGNQPKDIWINLPVRFSKAAVTAYITGIYAHHTSGKIKVEAGNEIWNGIYPFNLQQTFYYQAYLGGEEADGNGQPRDVYIWWADTIQPKPYTKTGTMGSYLWKDNNNNNIDAWETPQPLNAQQAAEFWALVEAVYPRNRVVRTLGSLNEVSDWATSLLKTSTSALGTYGPLHTKVDAFAIGSYMNFKHPTQNWKMRADEQARLRRDTAPVSTYLSDATAYNTVLASTALAVRNKLDALNPNIKLVSYEGYQHFNMTLPTIGFGALCNCTVDTNDNSLLYTPDTPDGGGNANWAVITRDEMFENGEVVRSYNGNAIVQRYENNGVTYFDAGFTEPFLQDQFYVSRFSTNKIRLHKTYADAIAGTNHLTLIAQPGNDTVEIANFTRMVGINNKTRELLSTETGRQLMIHWWNTVIRPYFDEVNFYTHAGSWQDGGQEMGVTWGLKSSELAADHPAAAQVRKMKNIGVTAAELLS